MIAVPRACGLLLVVVLCRCQGEDIRIPDGTYVSVDEVVEVSGSEIRFRIKLDDGAPSVVLDRYYDDYAVLPNGRIQPIPMASHEWATGVGRFDWRWNGEVITRVEPR